jgi:DMSO/TMAO reductase YedYZ molybdopterin-dependent catalytic subunit
MSAKVVNPRDGYSLSFRQLFFYGFLGGLVATVAAYMGTMTLSLPYPPEELLQLIIAPVPGAVQSVTVETFREYAKYSAFVSASVMYSIGYGLLGVLVGFLFRKSFREKIPQALLLATAIGTVVGLGFEGSLASTVSTLSTIGGWLMAAALMVAVNLAYAGIFVYQARRQITHYVTQGAQPVTSQWARRGFLKKVVIVLAVLVVAGALAKVASSLFSGQPVVRSGTPIPVNPQPENVDTNLPPIFSDPRISDLVGSEVSDNRVFYRVDINAIPPQLDFDKWSLKISGKVSNPTILAKNDVLSLPAKDEYATLECVSNTINPPGALISDTRWTGVSLPALLNQAGPVPEARYVIFRCADGYTVGLPLKRAMNPGALLAYKMDDEPLPNEHGFPLRAIVPGIYGMMNAKWITEIELTDQVYIGYWQERGWSNDATIKTTSIIYYPPSADQVTGMIPIAGVAFAGDRGISKVEVSVDGGNNWNEATLKKPRSPYSWVLWAYEWTPTSKGNTTIIVRAYDGTGTAQDANVTQPFPDGATGYHAIQVTVT